MPIFEAPRPELYQEIRTGKEQEANEPDLEVWHFQCAAANVAEIRPLI